MTEALIKVGKSLNRYLIMIIGYGNQVFTKLRSPVCTLCRSDEFAWGCGDHNDADLQHPPSVIPQLLDEWHKGSNIVNTLRIDQKKISFMKKKYLMVVL